MKKIVIAAALMLIGGAAVASAQTTPVAPPKADSAAKWAHDSAMKQGASTTDKSMEKAGQMASLDVNTATQAQLEAIPALKPYADKIIKGRPYKNIDQLSEKNIVPKDVLGATKSQLSVGSY